MKIYKIRNKDTGLYSSGGSSPRWTKKGKTWNNIGALKNHLSLVLKWYDRYDYQNAELVEFEIKYEEGNRNDIVNVIESMKQAREKELERIRKQQEEYKRKEELKELERLTKKYGKRE